MKTESSALYFSAVMALVIGIVAIVASLASKSQAILLDGLFNLIYFGVALVTIHVSRLATRPDDDVYPFGYTYFESLVNLCKGLMILGVTVFAVIDAGITLLTGGREIAAGLAIIYALFATVSCSITALLMHRSLKHQSSPLVSADKMNWVVNSIISAAVLTAFSLMLLFEYLGWHVILPYIDPVLVIAVGVLCLGVPVRMASQALQELLNKAPAENFALPVRKAVAKALAHVETKKVRFRMVCPGRTFYLMVHVVLPEDTPFNSLSAQDRLRDLIDYEARRYYPLLVCDVIFTADDRWAAPSVDNSLKQTGGTHALGADRADSGNVV